jgi:hypothetical protein
MEDESDDEFFPITQSLENKQTEDSLETSSTPILSETEAEADSSSEDENDDSKTQKEQVMDPVEFLCSEKFSILWTYLHSKARLVPRYWRPRYYIGRPRWPVVKPSLKTEELTSKNLDKYCFANKRVRFISTELFQLEELPSPWLLVRNQMKAQEEEKAQNQNFIPKNIFGLVDAAFDYHKSVMNDQMTETQILVINLFLL